MCPHFASRFVLLALTVLRCLPAVLCATNRTVDDQWGDQVTGSMPIYAPADNWQQGANCSTCYSRPNASAAHDGSWHDTSYIPGGPAPMAVSYQFNGTAVYAYCIIDNHSNYTTLTNLTFSLDNRTVGSYTHTPNPLAPIFEYGVPVYANASIPNGEHTFELEATAGHDGSVILFDYLQYTYEEPSDPRSTSGSGGRNTGAIAGGVVGGLAVLGLVIAAAGVLLVQRSRRHAATPFLSGEGQGTTSASAAEHTSPSMVPPLGRKMRNVDQPAAPRDVLTRQVHAALPTSPAWSHRIDALQQQVERLTQEQRVLAYEVRDTVVPPPVYEG